MWIEAISDSCCPVTVLVCQFRNLFPMRDELSGEQQNQDIIREKVLCRVKIIIMRHP